jgi:hypothetical protein
MLAHMQPELEIVLTSKYDVGYYWYFSLVPHTPPCTLSNMTDNSQLPYSYFQQCQYPSALSNIRSLFV